MKYLVTGATGGYGTYALGFLKELVPISDIAVLARTEEKAAPLKAAGFDVRLADYSDLTALEQAFTGIDRLLFVSGAPEIVKLSIKMLLMQPKVLEFLILLIQVFLKQKGQQVI